MTIVDVSGRVIDDLRPYHKNHIFVEVQRGAGMVAGKIYVEEDDSYPQTTAYIAELPLDMSVLNRHFPQGLKIGDMVLFKRYAIDLIAYDWGWVEVEVGNLDGSVSGEPKFEKVFMRTPIHALNVEDIECVVGNLQEPEFEFA